MENNKKNLKVLSIVILALAGLTLVRTLISVCVGGFPKVDTVPEGISKEVAEITVIITFVLSLVLLFPQIYVGVKGIMIANGAESGKAHIVWSLILAILAVIAVISGLSDLFKAFSLDALLSFIDLVLDFAVYALYFIYARKIAK
jgi:hypothetical protein